MTQVGDVRRFGKRWNAYCRKSPRTVTRKARLRDYCRKRPRTVILRTKF